ncbi:hypothetical protein IGI04_018809 [Brassica rapa subsp. trilocularis]|uniref:Uncharacterized protein n=1 Tax=Brassica rapa subsp. trilocularis TaxID=1813537 RepID=A0ABQ7MF30_BRACM|nr:hypothetical protein IGI04_018809 [Brassica rapa subsp. trilocularis]
MGLGCISTLILMLAAIMGEVSDHARCMVLLSDIREEVRRLFKFFTFLADREQFLPTVQSLWDTTEPLSDSRTTLSQFHHKLKFLKGLGALNNY